MDTTTAAHRLKIEESRLLAWEAGEQQPSITQLERAADLYQRPLAAFFLSAPPEEFAIVKDFRRLPGAPTDPSSELISELRKTGARREIVLELLEDLGEEPATFNLRSDPSESAPAAAERIRGLLGITPEDQRSWTDAYAALRGWRKAVEAKDVLVFQITGVRVKETRGFSTFYDRLPAIAINGKDAPTARCFTLMHELGHLLRRSGAVCDMREHNAAEVWCNRFAGELLVPASALRVQVGESAYREQWPDAVLSSLSRRFWVSAEVVLRRLVTIRLASQEFYDRWRASRGEEAASSGGPVPVPNRVLAHAGGTFVNLVLSAYHADRITASTLSNYLGMKLKHVPAIEALMLGGAS